jgi:hypothetical protein
VTTIFVNQEPEDTGSGNLFDSFYHALQQGLSDLVIQHCDNSCYPVSKTTPDTHYPDGFFLTPDATEYSTSYPKYPFVVPDLKPDRLRKYFTGLRSPPGCIV